jgi:hypothetical protein
VLDEAAWRGAAVGFDFGDALVPGRIAAAGWLARRE